MKRYIFLIVAIIFAVSCKPKSSMVKVQDDVLITENSQSAQNISDNETARFTEAEMNLIEEKTEKLVSRIVLYDTSQPVDSVTKKPPIMAEITTDLSTALFSNIRNFERNSESSKNTNIEESNSKDTLISTTHEKTEMKKESKGLKKIVFIVLLILLLLIFLFRFANKKSQIVSEIFKRNI